MAFLVYNKTGAPLPLAVGGVTVPLSLAPPARGQPSNVTDELRPDLTVDPARGHVGGLTAADFAALEAQRLLGTLNYEWTDDPEYATGALTVDGPLPGTHGGSHAPGGVDAIVTTIAGTIAVGDAVV